ncbi:unnamed protein product [Arctogadus glacialis]
MRSRVPIVLASKLLADALDVVPAEETCVQPLSLLVRRDSGRTSRAVTTTVVGPKCCRRGGDRSFCDCSI